jgi:hypothetical protein
MQKGQGGPHWGMILAAVTFVIILVILLIWIFKIPSKIPALLSGFGK